MDKLITLGYDAVYFREPSDSRWGREIKKKAKSPDSVTPEQELELFIADRRENVEKNLKPALQEKKVVVLDRYYFSTIAYQGAKGIDTVRIRMENEAFAVKPDLVFIMDIAPDKGLKRVDNRGSKDLLFEREDYLAEVRKIFKSFQGEPFIHINASKPIERIAAQIEKTAFAYLSSFLRRQESSSLS
jgi:dTMP kinase